MFKQRPTRAEIDLVVLTHNYRALQVAAGPQTAVMPVIKADAYGHGAVAAARALSELEIPGFAVATVAEATVLKEAGISEDILILGSLYEDDLEMVAAGGIIPVLWDDESARRLSEFVSSRGMTVTVQVKIDTGMGRAGIPAAAARELIKTITQLPGLQLGGLLSHLAIADSSRAWARRYTGKQFQTFTGITEAAAAMLPDEIPTRHLANSAGIIRYDFPGCTMARAGIALYGAYPDVDLYGEIDLKPVMSVKTGIVMLKKLRPGQSVSYGCTYTAREEVTVALLPIGYADGLNRALSGGRGEFLVRGRRVPVIGRVCMDWTMIEVSDINGVAVGDEVVIIGRQGDEVISVDQMAAALGTISYEIFCSWSSRVRREYFDSRG